MIDRCNLTVLFEPGQQDTAAFLAQQRVNVVASLPCYTADNVEKQRGKGVFDKSIEVLARAPRAWPGRPRAGTQAAQQPRLRTAGRPFSRPRLQSGRRRAAGSASQA